MKDEKIKNTAFEYLKTFAITVLITFLLVIALFFSLQYSVFSELDAKKLQHDTIEYYMVGFLIDKNVYLGTKYPKNYKINLRLGILYELSGDYKKAEENLKLAIEKKPYNEFFPNYKLARVYIKFNKLADAQAVMDKIPERYNKKLLFYKTDIYKRLGDQYYNKAEYAEAIDRYKKALSYAKIIKSNEIVYLKKSLASSYVYLADQYVLNMQITEAIEALTEAISIVDAPILKYKLALLYMQKKPGLAYNYFEDVFKKEPAIISYDTYYAFLSKLANDADFIGDKPSASLFRYKIDKLKEYFQSNILYLEDLEIINDSGIIKTKIFSKNYDIATSLSIKNKTRFDIKSLFLEIVFSDENGDFDTITKQIANEKFILRGNCETPIILLKTKKKILKSDKRPKKIQANIYLYKTEGSYKLLFKTIDIKELK